ncbi:WD repeat-containing [Colletotrichum kahawae]|uniref:WD repeat-containing n=1 Tax=Colletotrichum kahawae TaxID=34407 RepID=A0AAE0D3G8_COLKA|nr:WD repeat-containing [Colletotrichum kahawae]
MVEDYLSTGQPFQSLKARLEYLANRPKSLSKALATGSAGMVAIFLERRFDKAATGDYQWLVDLKDMGYSEIEMADLLYQKFHDGHWIYFETSVSPESSIFTSAPAVDHLEHCAHTCLSAGITRKRSRAETGSALGLGRETKYTIEELCGLAGIAPYSREVSSWNGTVDFIDDKEGLTATISHWIAGSSSPMARELSGLQNVLQQTIAAAIVLQTEGICCESFTLLMAVDGSSQNRQLQVQIRKFDFGIIVAMADQLQKLSGLLSNGETIDQTESFQRITASLEELSSSVVPCPRRTPESIRETLNYVSLAIQALRVGLLCYTQAHIGKLHPFFLDTPIHQLVLVGLDSTSSTVAQNSLRLKVCLTKLTCLHDMLEDEVMVFYPPTCEPDFGKRFDVVGNLEDVVDTWGPASLVYRKQQQDVPVAVALRGGFIGRPLSARTSRSFHWDHNFGSLETSIPLELKEEIVIGSLIQEDTTHCNNKPEDCRAAWNLYELGTCNPLLVASGYQYGTEFGPEYFKLNAAKTYTRVPAVTIKNTMKYDYGALVHNLDQFWGLRIRYQDSYFGR